MSIQHLNNKKLPQAIDLFMGGHGIIPIKSRSFPLMKSYIIVTFHDKKQAFHDKI